MTAGTSATGLIKCACAIVLIVHFRSSLIHLVVPITTFHADTWSYEVPLGLGYYPPICPVSREHGPVGGFVTIKSRVPSVYNGGNGE